MHLGVRASTGSVDSGIGDGLEALEEVETMNGDTRRAIASIPYSVRGVVGDVEDRAKNYDEPKTERQNEIVEPQCVPTRRTKHQKPCTAHVQNWAFSAYILLMRRTQRPLESVTY
jgi:hypothetical protein